MNLEETLFILGADDLEMDAIEGILKNIDPAHYCYALDNNGVRVDNSNAYTSSVKAGTPIRGYFTVVDPTKYTNFVLVECSIHIDGWVKEWGGNSDDVEVFKFDHWYLYPEEKVIEKSALGQVLLYLIDYLPYTTEGGVKWDEEGNLLHIKKIVIPQYLKIIAACDHCPNLARAGKIPGLSKEEVEDFLAKSG